MFEHLSCPHGHGIWHWVVDIGMLIPFVAYGWFWLKSKFQIFYLKTQIKKGLFSHSQKNVEEQLEEY